MARHNREGGGQDQKNERYRISYQPDWLRFVKVTRRLDSGRQSTMTLFRNPTDRPEAPPGERVRTRVVCPGQDLDFSIAVSDPNHAIRRVRVSYVLPDEAGGRPEEVEFTLEGHPPHIARR